jgi:hypothetical protein
MSHTSQNFDIPLEQAEAQLRDIFQRHLPNAPAEAGSLGRMLNHVVNIRRAVSESTDDHANAAKRLGDFALTVERMAKRAPANDEEMTARIHNLANTLKTAGSELASVKAAPAVAGN